MSGQTNSNFKYHAAPKDFAAVEDGISLAHKHAPDVFPKGIDDIDIVMYDSDNMYVWSNSRYSVEQIDQNQIGYFIHRVPHNASLQRDYFARCGGFPQELWSVVETLGHTNFFSCAPVTTFTRLQQERGHENPFSTRKSYLLTLIHEYGHLYMPKDDDSKLLSVIEAAASRVEGGDARSIVSEAFAMYHEFEIAKDFYPGYIEKVRRWLQQFPSTNSHAAGSTIAREILAT